MCSTSWPAIPAGYGEVEAWHWLSAERLHVVPGEAQQHCAEERDERVEGVPNPAEARFLDAARLYWLCFERSEDVVDCCAVHAGAVVEEPGREDAEETKEHDEGGDDGHEWPGGECRVLLQAEEAEQDADRGGDHSGGALAEVFVLARLIAVLLVARKKNLVIESLRPYDGRWIRRHQRSLPLEEWR